MVHAVFFVRDERGLVILVLARKPSTANGDDDG